MFGIAGRRIAEALVALFALLGFAFVPLGQKTAFEHSVAIFTTPAALNAFRDVTRAVYGLKERLLELVRERAQEAPPPEPGAGPKPDLPELPKARP